MNIQLNHWYHKKPLNIAHRGASGHAPQNTLAAFILAADMGADGIELDVHLSADGEVVVIHDDTVDATTDGHGQVSRMTLAELKRLDAGCRFRASVSYPPDQGRIPTLQEVFDVVGHRLTMINVEIKVEQGYHPLDQEAETVRLIEDCGMLNKVIISSFSLTSLKRVRRLNPHIPLGLLYAHVQTALFPAAAGLLGTPFDALHPQFTLVNVDMVQQARRRGQRVHAWTVNQPADMRRMLDCDLDGIITNYPDVLHQLVQGQPG